jgi:hypothetical protein
VLADFHWLRPEWLVAIPLVVLVAVVFARGRLGAGNWRDVVDPALMPYVLSRAPGRGADYRWWLLGLGGVLAVLALAGPAWQRIEQPVFRAEQALVVALDLSRSMDCTGCVAQPPCARPPQNPRHTRASQEWADGTRRLFIERVYGDPADNGYGHGSRTRQQLEYRHHAEPRQ